MSIKNATLYEVMCGKVSPREVSFMAGANYDKNVLTELVRDNTERHPDEQIPVAAFNTFHVLLDKAEAFRIASNQIAAYRVWIYEHLDNYGALLQDLKS